jgi:uncharacterized repeat protein (TIGR03803 family)
MLRRRFPFWLGHCFTILMLAATLASTARAGSKFKVLYNFKGGTDAAGPYAGVTFDQKGKLYGTTLGGGGGGNCNGGCGTVFELVPHRDRKWTETVVHSFDYSPVGPFGGLVAGPQGGLYGTTNSNEGSFLFEVTANGKWNQFKLPDGGSWATLLADTGPFYGTGGSGVFEVSDSGGWQQNVIYTFHPQPGKDGTDGSSPQGTLIPDGAGHLYGVTEFGGNYSKCSGSGGCGTVFKLSRDGNGRWKEHMLHRFARFTNDGQLPMAGVVMDAAGNLYGTTYEGGKYQTGTIYKLSRDKTGQWKETILFHFPRVEDGGGPTANLVLDSKGNLYGTAGGGGGSCSCGVVFEFKRGSGGKWEYSVLHRFTGADGGMVEAGLTPDGKGNFYGTTPWGGTYLYGVVFAITP